MKRMILAALALIAIGAQPALAAPEVGKPAPDFTAKDINGKDVKLSALKGKTVVLEWTNHQCPFVVKQYDTKNMQTLQEKATKDGVVWISIVSSAKGKEGYVTADEAKKNDAESGAKYTHKILDESGEIGKLYDAKTTPHMFVVNAEGNVVYMGAIDSNPSPRLSAVEGATNYVAAALDALKAGKPVEPSSTQPYGCGVKY